MRLLALLAVAAAAHAAPIPPPKQRALPNMVGRWWHHVSADGKSVGAKYLFNKDGTYAAHKGARNKEVDRGRWRFAGRQLILWEEYGGATFDWDGKRWVMNGAFKDVFEPRGG